jgi:deferrochelatase/peroxidase EfeB
MNWKIVLMQKEVAVVGGDGKSTSASNVKALFKYEDDGKTKFYFQVHLVLDISTSNSLCLFQAVGNMIKEVGDTKIVHAYAAIDMAMYQFPP